MSAFVWGQTKGGFVGGGSDVVAATCAGANSGIFNVLAAAFRMDSG
jgi:hypothetical protein